ncbi:MAG: tetratricopeptide repeat protein [Sphingobacteriales bacterium]|nr:MAG: tetratricopeptide repeat protein [Sphingobacteriales bacterium]
MRPAHYITIAAAIGLIALLYWGGNTVPPAKKNGEMPMASAEGGAHDGPHAAKAASVDSILAASRAKLPQHAAEEVAAIENEIKAMHDSSRMASVFTRLAKTWQQHKQMPAAAYYFAKAAKLENSEKSLNFAGQFFLDLIHDAGSQEIATWEAQEAIDCFKRALVINPDNDTTKMALAASYIEGTGETMQGVQLLLGITREKPDNVPATLMLGRLAIQSGQFDKAIQRFETVLKIEPKNTEAMYFLAEAYKGKGNKEKAIELFEQTKKIVNNPDFSRDIDQYINSFK